MKHLNQWYLSLLSFFELYLTTIIKFDRKIITHFQGTLELLRTEVSFSTVTISDLQDQCRYVRKYLHVYVLTCVRTYSHVYIHTYSHLYLRTHFHVYVGTHFD
jgi:hypothetical protein